MTDLHSHLLPLVDDGAGSWDDARRALETVAAAGVGTTVVTPHVVGSLTRTPSAMRQRLSELDDVWPPFVELAATATPDLRVARAAEVMLDRPDVDLSDPRLRLDGTRFALVEFPFMGVPPRSAETLYELGRRGWTPVLAHPERYRGLERGIGIVEEWRQAGAVLQLNAGSLLGGYGSRVKEVAFLLLRGGLVDVISSDYHARGPFPTATARALLEKEYAAPAALLALLFEENGARLLEGSDPRPVPPLPRRLPVWKRIFS